MEKKDSSKTLNLVEVSKVNSIEEYVMVLATFQHSLASLITLNQTAEKIGILDDSEMQLAKTLSWEAQRCNGYILKIMDYVLERTPFDPYEQLDKMKKSMLEGK